MRKILYIFAALVLAVMARPSMSAELVTSSVPPAKGSPARMSVVYPPSGASVYASLLVMAPGGSKVDFIWTDPSGGVYARSRKLARPGRDGAAALVWDSVVLPDASGVEAHGWWSVKAVYPEGEAARRFLVSSEPGIQVLNGTQKPDKLGYLGSLDAERDATGRAFGAAALDPDPEMRSAVMRLLEAHEAVWAADILSSAQDDTDPAVRSAAVSGLVKRGGDTALGAAEKAAVDASAAVRITLAELLGDVDAQWTVGMLDRLYADPDGTVRSVALAALGRKDGPGVAEIVAKGFADESTALRRGAMDILLTKDSPARASILEELLDDRDPVLRNKAVKSLAVIDGGWDLARAVPLLDDPDEDTALAAFGALSRAGYRIPVADAFGSRHRKVRLGMVRYLSGKDAMYASEGLTIAVADADTEVRTAALDGLVDLGDAGVPGLKAALSGEYQDARLVAVEALSGYSPELVGGDMIRASGDPYAPVRLAAMKYMAANRIEGTVGVLAAAGDDESRDVRNFALGLLCEDTSEASSAAIGRYYDTPDTAMRYRVLACLDGRSDAAAVSTFTSALKDIDPGIRVMAVEALAGSGNTALAYRMVLDPDQDVKRAALLAMKESPGPAMTAVLKEVMSDANKGVRVMALEVLEDIEGPEVGSIISGAVNDVAVDVRELARDIVMDRDDKGAATGLATMTGDTDPSVRRAAARALAGLSSPGVEEVIVASYPEANALSKAELVGVLFRRGSDKLYQVMTSALADEDAGVRASAVAAAGKLPSGQRERAYTAMASYVHPDVRLEAAREVTGQDATRVLLQLLLDKDAEVRRAASSRLDEVGEGAVSVALPRLITDPDRDVALNAFRFVRSHEGSVDAVAAYVAAASGPHPVMADEAAERLARFGDHRALPVMLYRFKSGRDRDEMLEGISNVPGPDAIAPLGEAYRASSGDEGLRTAAVRALGGRGAAALPVLEDALSDISAKVRLETVKSIGSVEDAPERTRLLGLAVKDADSGVGREAVRQLSVYGSPEALSVIMSALNSGDLSSAALDSVRAIVSEKGASGISADAVGRIANPEYRLKVVDIVLASGPDAETASRLLADRDWDIRLKVVAYISGVQGRDATYRLFLAGADPDPDVRNSAAEAISARTAVEVSSAVDMMFDRGMPSPPVLEFATGIIRDTALLSRIVSGLDAKDSGRMWAAMRPVAARHAGSDVPVILVGLKSDDPALRVMLIRTLAHMSQPEGADALAQAYNRYPSLRKEIIDNSSGTPGFGRVFVLALAGDDMDARMYASRKLTAVSGKDTAALLSTAMDSPDAEVRVEAVRAAGINGEFDILVSASTDPSPSVRAEAASALGAADSERAVEILKNLAADDDRKVSDAALDSLEKHAKASTEGVWLELASQPSNNAVRLAVIRRLSKRKDPRYCKVLTGTLSDPDGELASAAAAGLADIGIPCLPDVHEALADPDARNRALGVVSGIADPSSEEAVAALVRPGTPGDLPEVFKALGKVGGPAGLAAVAGVFDGLSAPEKASAIRAVMDMRLTGSEPVLAGMLSGGLSDPDEGVRLLAASAAGKLRVAALRDTLSEMSGTESSSLVKDAIKRAIGRIDGEQ